MGFNLERIYYIRVPKTHLIYKCVDQSISCFIIFNFLCTYPVVRPHGRFNCFQWLFIMIMHAAVKMLPCWSTKSILHGRCIFLTMIRSRASNSADSCSSSFCCRNTAFPSERPLRWTHLLPDRRFESPGHTPAQWSIVSLIIPDSTIYNLSDGSNDRHMLASCMQFCCRTRATKPWQSTKHISIDQWQGDRGRFLLKYGHRRVNEGCKTGGIVVINLQI
jgi:hypothetical protein